MSDGIRDARAFHNKLTGIMNSHYVPKFGRYDLRPTDSGVLTFHSLRLHVKVIPEYVAGSEWPYLKVVREDRSGRKIEERRFRLGRKVEADALWKYLDEVEQFVKRTVHVVVPGPYGPRVIG